MPALDGSLSCDWLAPFGVDIALTLAVHWRGPGDPAFRVDGSGAVWRTSLTPAGPATLRLTSADGGRAQPVTSVQATAWGEGARWLLARVPDLIGAQDEPAAFRPEHPRLRELVRQYPRLRLGRTDRVLEALVPAVLEQKVLSLEAHRAWRNLLRWHGLPAPGPAPAGMRVFPSPATWRAIPSWDWHRAGVEGVRAQTIIRACTVADSLERLLAKTHEEADRLLRTIPGIGPWTSAETRQRAAGDPDAVSVGDAHLPDMVGWALAGRSATNDEEMLELLGPYAGHRHRVTRLVRLSGLGGPPRRAPKLPVRDYRRF